VEAPPSVKSRSGGITNFAAAEEIRRGRGPATAFGREGGVAARSTGDARSSTVAMLASPVGTEGGGRRGIRAVAAQSRDRLKFEHCGCRK